MQPHRAQTPFPLCPPPHANHHYDHHKLQQLCWPISKTYQLNCFTIQQPNYISVNVQKLCQDNLSQQSSPQSHSNSNNNNNNNNEENVHKQSQNCCHYYTVLIADNQHIYKFILDDDRNHDQKHRDQPNNNKNNKQDDYSNSIQIDQLSKYNMLHTIKQQQIPPTNPNHVPKHKQINMQWKMNINASILKCTQFTCTILNNIKTTILVVLTVDGLCQFWCNSNSNSNTNSNMKGNDQYQVVNIKGSGNGNNNKDNSNVNNNPDNNKHELSKIKDYFINTDSNGLIKNIIVIQQKQSITDRLFIRQLSFKQNLSSSQIILACSSHLKQIIIKPDPTTSTSITQFLDQSQIIQVNNTLYFTHQQSHSLTLPITPKQQHNNNNNHNHNNNNNNKSDGTCIQHIQTNNNGLIAYCTLYEIVVYDRVEGKCRGVLAMGKEDNVVRIGFVGDKAIGAIIMVANARVEYRIYTTKLGLVWSSILAEVSQPVITIHNSLSHMLPQIPTIFQLKSMQLHNFPSPSHIFSKIQSHKLPSLTEPQLSKLHESTASTLKYRYQILKTLQNYMNNNDPLSVIRYLSNSGTVNNHAILCDGLRLVRNRRRVSQKSDGLSNGSGSGDGVDCSAQLMKLSNILLQQSKYQSHIQTALQTILHLTHHLKQIQSTAHTISTNKLPKKQWQECINTLKQIIGSRKLRKLQQQQKNKYIFQLCYELVHTANSHLIKKV